MDEMPSKETLEISIAQSENETIAKFRECYGKLIQNG
jgi:hypothetical protein